MSANNNVIKLVNESVRFTLISDVFCENKYNLFVKYCNDNSLVYVGDLESFDFYQLLGVTGIGKGKVDDIIGRYESIIDGIFSLDEPGRSESTLFCDISSDVGECSIDFIACYDVKQKSIDRLKSAGYKSIGDLRSIVVDSLLRNMTKGDFDKLISREENLSWSLKDVIADILSGLIGNRDYEIVLLRENGCTLEEIGRRYSVQRERSRQIINRFEEKIAPFMVVIQKKLLSNKNYILSEEITDIYDNDDFDKILLRWFKDNDNFEYLSFADAFIYLNGDKKHYEKDLLLFITDFIGQDVFSRENIDELEKMIHEKGYPFIDEAAILNLVQQNGYYVYENYITKGRLSYGYLCSKIVEQYFPNGIKLYEGSDDLKLLREYATKKYGDIGISDDDRAFSARLSDYLILSDKGSVTAASNIEIDYNLLTKIKEYIDDANERELYYSNLYSLFESELRKSSNVHNHYFLHGILKLCYSEEYDFSNKDYLTKKGDGLSSGKFADRLLSYIESVKRPVSKNEIKENFPGVTDIVLVNCIISSDKLMQWGYNAFYSLSCIKISDEDKDILLKSTLSIMKDNRGYCSDKMLFDEIRVKAPLFIQKNKIKDEDNLYYICMKLFSELFEFRRPHIMKKNTVEKLSVKNVSLHMLGYPRLLSYSAYQELANRFKWTTITVNMVFRDIEEDYIRINDEYYIAKSELNIQSETITQIKTVIMSKMNRGFVSLIAFDAWNQLPNVGYEWNSYLLRSIVDRFIDSISVIEVRKKDRRYERGILVRSGSMHEDYADVVICLLRRLGITQLEENKMCNLLVDYGLTYKMIPKELYVSDKIKYKEGLFYLA